MKARFLTLAVVLAWPSFAHAGWFNDTIGRPITGGLAQGAHVFKDTMVTGAKQTGAAFSSAAHEAGLDRPQSNQPPPLGAGGRSSAAPAPQDADKRAPNAQPSPVTDTSRR
jgi:hypothetical protein